MNNYFFLFYFGLLAVGRDVTPDELTDREMEFSLAFSCDYVNCPIE
jgi:hypothetical protein